MSNERLEKGIPVGSGAAAFAKALFAGMSVDRARNEMNAYLNGELNDKTDPRIKDCAYCGYLYRDITKPNSSKVCSPECKKGIDAERKRDKRHAKGEVNRYDSRNYETPYAPHKIEAMDAAQQGEELFGGRRGRYNSKERQNEEC